MVSIIEFYTRVVVQVDVKIIFQRKIKGVCDLGGSLFILWGGIDCYDGVLDGHILNVGCFLSSLRIFLLIYKTEIVNFSYSLPHQKSFIVTYYYSCYKN